MSEVLDSESGHEVQSCILQLADAERLHLVKLHRYEAEVVCLIVLKSCSDKLCSLVPGMIGLNAHNMTDTNKTCKFSARIGCFFIICFLFSEGAPSHVFVSCPFSHSVCWCVCLLVSI